MERFLDAAFAEARKAQSIGEVPVGCVFVYKNQVIASGGNYVNATKNATRHAEFVCIDQAIKYCQSNNLEQDSVFREISVVVTVEPCIMCASALCNLNVKEVIYGCANDRFGGKTILNVPQLLNHGIPFKGGYRADEAMDLLKEFYKGVNPAAPVPKVKKNKNEVQIS